MTIRSPIPFASIAALAAFAAPSLAFAQVGGTEPLPLSADPEIVNIRFGKDQIAGVPVPAHDVANTVHFGTFFQYELNPVVGYRLDEWAGNIIVNRVQAHLGMAWDFKKWGSVRLSVPFAITSGSNISDLAPKGGDTAVALGDIYAGLSLTPLQTRFFNLGVHGDVWAPTGAKNMYAGEGLERIVGGETTTVGTGRVSGGLTGMVKFWEYVDLIGDVSVLGRTYRDTKQDFELGSELWISEALRIKLPWIPVHITQALITRGGFENFWQKGAENGVEIYGGVQIPIRNIGFNTSMTIDAMAGRGTNQGFGTSDLRVVAGLSFFRNPGKKPVVIVEKVEKPPVVIPPPVLVEEPPPPPEWGEGQIVRRVDDAIEIKQPIEFFVDTATIKPESLPILEQVAEIINSDYRIKHLVIEGHASEEGSFEYNYDLSTRRAESIFRQLILDQVPPDRISYKAYGEVKPKVLGSTEEAWAVNRRVEFKIVSQYAADDPKVPDSYGATTLLPWNGESSPVKSPRTPKEIAAEKAAADEAARKEQIRRDRFEEVDETLQFEEKKQEGGRERPEKKTDDLGDMKFDDDDDDKKAPPAEPAPAEPAPAEPAPAEPAPAESAPAEPTPAPNP